MRGRAGNASTAHSHRLRGIARGGDRRFMPAPQMRIRDENAAIVGRRIASPRGFDLGVRLIVTPESRQQLGVRVMGDQ